MTEELRLNGKFEFISGDLAIHDRPIAKRHPLCSRDLSAGIDFQFIAYFHGADHWILHRRHPGAGDVGRRRLRGIRGYKERQRQKSESHFRFLQTG
jgi:hypothetical protein